MTNLQRIRKEQGLTQKQLAEKSGVPLKMIQKYESGERNINHARLLTVTNLALALKVRTSDLIECDVEATKALNYCADHFSEG